MWGISAVTAAIAGFFVLAAGIVVLTPVVFAERVLPTVRVGATKLAGVAVADVPGALRVYEAKLQSQTVLLVLRDQTVTRTLGELGVGINIPATAERIASIGALELAAGGNRITPVLSIDTSAVARVIEADFGDHISVPHSATLQLGAGDQLALVPSAVGEGIDLMTLEQDIIARIGSQAWQRPIELVIVSAAPAVLDTEVAAARDFAGQLLRDGFTLTVDSGEEPIVMQPGTVRRLLEFAEQVEPGNANNRVLGVTFASDGLTDYLTETIAPLIDRPAVNARFERDGDRVAQFAVPQAGRQLDREATSAGIVAALRAVTPGAALAITVTEPAIRDTADIEALGVTTLLASGTSDFAGSPPNRIHNIKVGVERYHGLLIPPDTEFSFNEFLGPVTAAAGFKPELVIKHNVTTPEYGGGLCQVSTTAFRAAVNSGLEITQRRNHAYAVRYYGTPGFDATIYPPYTDLRFSNNTPGYILIQARVEGTTVIFDFWGTDDGREVTVTGPDPYGYQANGAVKATLQQTVVKDGDTIIDERFHSNYRSPALFPKVLAADDPARAAVSPSPAPAAPGNTPASSHVSTPRPTPNPSAAPTPAS